MTGRLLLSRPGYPVDHKKRSSMPAPPIWSSSNSMPIPPSGYGFGVIPYAMEKGVLISIDPTPIPPKGIMTLDTAYLPHKKEVLRPKTI